MHCVLDHKKSIGKTKLSPEYAWGMELTLRTMRSLLLLLQCSGLLLMAVATFSVVAETITSKFITEVLEILGLWQSFVPS